MHRHGYKGRKFGRERDQREALIQSLSEALIIHGSIETTIHKAKELVPYVEKLITKAKKGDLHNRRQIIAKLQTLSSAHKLVDDIAPQLSGRVSGHLRIERAGFRRGDNAEMARVSFVDELKAETASSAVASSKSSVASKPGAKVVTDAKATAKPGTKPRAAASRNVKSAAPAAARRTGARGGNK